MDEENLAAGPHEVLDRLFGMMEADDKLAVADLLAEDGVMEWPFMRPGAPNVVRGPEEMRRFVRRSAASDVLRYERVERTVHETRDPEVVIAELTVRGTNIETNAPFQLRAISVIRVRNGAIVSYRDYVDPVNAARQAGRLPQVIAALSAELGR